MKNRKNRGFTLIELLIVIGILGILASALILALNPSEMLKKSRDSQRISDFSTLQTAMNLAFADSLAFKATDPDDGTFTTALKTYSTLADAAGAPSLFNYDFDHDNDSGTLNLTGIAAEATVVTDSDRQNNTGKGWIPMDFTVIPSGAPVAVLPLDPTNSGSYYYRFIHTGTGQYKIDCAMEASANLAKHGSDGGANANRYEIGNRLDFTTN
ncbi:hypothetical protein AUK11_02465 [bacterium CG2_30_37_16]|nr:MAG: hypothetical protein AUK11_02465 [bacterium CG2_30_37_16]PIP30273.1 MAG: hypothetical protein COX25_05615 [bacterium (Candidatus Howlettbacteria) CG23_combo_of_CG06-09_8_20_14_all_37_9]PIY00105.1 MAG: hypothetical protein COZ22_01165 [bacterium (Candidatus Howlettbacteria) CG_4_10_14_3_um_filter_37_10]PJB06566.1 MAG: hypothetical protein CO123_01970 [bacterium (Candidatus Howlettbacteria) CG_4_9_14_3_um_filter_37_10]